MPYTLSFVQTLFSLVCVGAFAQDRTAQELAHPLDKTLLVAQDTAPSVPIQLTGFVVDSDGAPAEGAVVVSSAGGETVTDRNGSYRLEVSVSLDATSVQVTAVSPASGSLAASASVAVTSGGVQVEPLTLSIGLACHCQPSWLSTFGERPGVYGGGILALTVFDDGNGSALYVGGLFTFAGGVAASRIAKWDGSSWAALGSGMNGNVQTLTVYDDGSGPALYAGGAFTLAGGVAANGIAKWNGASWSALGSGMSGGTSTVYALTVHDDGSGPALYAGGTFTNAGGAAASGIARWNGSSWSALGSGVSGGTATVYALTEFDDGSGPALYAGGPFDAAGGSFANRIAKWNGSTWSPVGSGVDGFGVIDALTVHDDGSGPALYAGGAFGSISGVAVSSVAKWDGSSWAALGSGIQFPSAAARVHALMSFDDGSGAELYAGGEFTMAGGLYPVFSIAKWGGSEWSGVGGGLGLDVRALCAFDGGNGLAVHAAGHFGSTAQGEVVLDGIGAWNGASWSPLGSGAWGTTHELTSLDDGSGPSLFAAFRSDMSGGNDVIATWNGSLWSPVATTNGAVEVLTTFDDGSGPALYAAGGFNTAGSVPALRIAKWDGATWTPLGTGMNDYVFALTVFDAGSGPALYAGGAFTTAGGVQVDNVAKWDGSSWSALGGGMDFHVLALTVHDDGSGPALYAGGKFTTAGGVAASRIARWDGSSWSALGSGMSGGDGAPWVNALSVYDDGGGPALYAGGGFTKAGGRGANRMAKWDGSDWSALGGGMNDAVHALTVFDDGRGPALYAGGAFTTASLSAANRIARWDGSSWTALGSGTSDLVTILTTHDDGSGPALYSGGQFHVAFDCGDAYMARWRCGPDTTPPTISCPPAVLVGERIGSPPGEVVSFSVTTCDDHDPAPTVVCVPPSGSLFPPGTTLVTCTATDVDGNQAVSRFPVTVARGIRPP